MKCQAPPGRRDGSPRHACPAEQPGKGAAGQRPATLLHTKHLFLNKVTISTAVPHFRWWFKGLCAPWPISLQSGRQPCTGEDVKIRDFSPYGCRVKTKKPHTTRSRNYHRGCHCAGCHAEEGLSHPPLPTGSGRAEPRMAGTRSSKTRRGILCRR